MSSSHDTGGAPRNFLDTSVTISDTKGVRDKLTLTQFSPGVYGATTSGLTEGVYSVRVEQVDKEARSLVASQSTGLVVPYPGEFRLSDDGGQAAKALLTDLAQLGGGKELDITQPSAAFTHDITAQPQRTLLWSWLLLRRHPPLPHRHSHPSPQLHLVRPPPGHSPSPPPGLRFLDDRR